MRENIRRKGELSVFIVVGHFTNNVHVGHSKMI